MQYEFRLPDIGEGVAEGEVLKWMVKEGDKIVEDQPLVEVMTDKVNIEIPSPKGGTVFKVLAREGEVIKVGQPMVVILTEEGEAAETQATVREERTASSVPGASDGSGSVAQSSGNVLATPATRRIARELGVELSTVSGTGQGGRITEEDVRSAAGSMDAGGRGVQRRGSEEIIPLRGVRKIIAERLAKASAMTAHVTHFDEADVTNLISLRESLRAKVEKSVKLTFLPFFVKAAVAALKEFPILNSTLDEKINSIVVKKYYNIGIASDTEQGLIVPVVRNADSKTLFQLAIEIEEHAERARAGHLDLQEVQGSTFTITNLGGIGGLFATPIINYPEVAILGTHKIMKRAVVRDGEVQVRDMIYLSLTFDHRVADGAYAARFMNRLVEIIQDPRVLASEIA